MDLVKYGGSKGGYISRIKRIFGVISKEVFVNMGGRNWELKP
jgi:hypothetical protein